MRALHKMLHLVGMAMVAVSSLVATDGQAFVDTPILLPQNPQAGESVSVSIRTGQCDGIIEWDGYPQVTRTGNNVRLVVYSQHIDFNDFCIFLPLTNTFTIGKFLPGSYTVLVDRDYFDEIKGPITETLGVLPFTVSGQPIPVSLPSGDISTWVTLLGGIVLLAGFSSRRHGAAFLSVVVLAVALPAVGEASTFEGGKQIELPLSNEGSPLSSAFRHCFPAIVGAMACVPTSRMHFRKRSSRPS